MKKKIALLIVLIVLSIPVCIWAADMKTGIIDTEAYPCDSLARVYRWTNTMGYSILIKKVTTWIGVSLGARVDIYASLWRESDGHVVSFVGWDRYGEPTGLHQWTYDFSPDWMELKPGDSLLMQTVCTEVTGRKGRIGHVAIFFNYTVGASLHRPALPE